jgi:hypothetical protein
MLETLLKENVLAIPVQETAIDSNAERKNFADLDIVFGNLVLLP